MNSLHCVMTVLAFSAAASAQPPLTPAAKLDTLLRRAADKATQTEALRLELLAFGRAHPGTAIHRKAAIALTALPSPLDKLDAAKIDVALRKLLDLAGLVAVTRAHDRAIAALAFAPDGRRLASSSWDNTVRVWSLDTAKPKALATIDGSPSGIAFMADGTALATGTAQAGVVIWDVTATQPKVRYKLSGHARRPFALQIAPGGAMLASGSLQPVLRLWRFAAGEPEIWAALANEEAPSLGISSLSFSADAKLLAAGSLVGKQTLRIWDVGGNYLDEKGVPAAQARVVQFSPVAPEIAFAGNGPVIRRWSVGGVEPKELPPLKGHRGTGTPPAITALAFGPTGTLLASSGHDRRLIVWDLATGQPRHEWQLPVEARAMAFAPDGRHLAVGNADGTLLVIRLPTVAVR